jgi:5-methylcytosine-specific restriction endonuclease McrA
MSDIDVALRGLVRERAFGLCEYCRISERFTLAEHEIDHVIAVKHGGQTVADNLALCCAVCNRFKGSDIASIDPETRQLTPLFHPRTDRWADHFQVQSGEIVGLTSRGRVTIQLLQMNRPTRIRERQAPTFTSRRGS